MSLPWKPSNPERWSMLGLDDPPADGQLPERAQTADLLAFALMLPGADDPVTGLIDSVRVELGALARLLEEHDAGDVLLMLSNRLAVASVFLRRCDNRVPPVPEYDPDAVTVTEPPKNGNGGANDA